MRSDATLFVGALLSALVVTALSTLLHGQATDPIVGTWTLDRANSAYTPGPAPTSTTITVTPAGDAFSVAVAGVNADGSPFSWAFTTSSNGTDEASVTGNPLFDTVLSTRNSATSSTELYKRRGTVVMTATTTITADGKSMTVRMTGTGTRGQAVDNRSVYTKR